MQHPHWAIGHRPVGTTAISSDRDEDMIFREVLPDREDAEGNFDNMVDDFVLAQKVDYYRNIPRDTFAHAERHKLDNGTVMEFYLVATTEPPVRECEQCAGDDVV